MKAPSVPGNIFASVKISEILSETKRKTERKARYAARTANTKTAQCARRLFSEGLAHVMFLLAVFLIHLFLFLFTKSSLLLSGSTRRRFALSDLLDKPWSQVSSLLPPGTCLQFLSRIGFSIPAARRFSSNVANSRSRAFRYSIFMQ